MKWSKLHRKYSDADVYFVYDELNQDREKLCALRKLPALLRLGAAQTTYPKSWRKLDQWSTKQYEFETPPYVLLDDIPFEPNENLIAISDQYYEDNLPIYTLSRVMNRYVDSEAKLVIGSGNRDFEPHGAKRPLEESPFVGATHSYHDIYDAFFQRSKDVGYPYPLKYTKNVFVQENAALYVLVSGEDITTLEEFFYNLPDAPYLPIWKTFSQMFTQDRRKGALVLDGNLREGLRKWLRRRVEVEYTEADELSRNFNALARRQERLFDPAHRAKMQQMESAAQTLTTFPDKADDKYVERLKSWLQESLNEF